MEQSAGDLMVPLVPEQARTRGPGTSGKCVAFKRIALDSFDSVH